MNTITDEKIYRLQRNLPIIRNLAGWTAEDLGTNIGVTRQTITNLEKSETLSMTKTQYIAIRTVLDYEIERSNNTTLDNAVTLLVDTDDLTEDQAKKVNDTVKDLSSVKPRRVHDKAILEGMKTMIAAVGVISGAVLTIAGKSSGTPKWLKDLMK